MSGLFESSGAELSACGTYRYRLWRAWDERADDVVWVMLNPSTADADQDDPTIRRCIGFARAWGYGGIIVVNLFALRATDPKALREHEAPVGPENDGYLYRAMVGAPLVIAAWGATGWFRSRSEDVRTIARQAGAELHHLGLTKHGFPRHPLYLPKTATPTPWRCAA